MSSQYVACFPDEDRTTSVWVFDSKAKFVCCVLELIVRERLKASDAHDDPPPEVEATVQSFCAITAPGIEAKDRVDAAVFMDVLDAAFPMDPNTISLMDGVQWAGSAADLLDSSDILVEIFRDSFKGHHGAKPTLATLDQFLEFLLEEWP